MFRTCFYRLLIIFGAGSRLQMNAYSKTCVKRSLSEIPKIGFHDQLSLNAGQNNCKMLQWVILQYFRSSLSYQKYFVLSIFEWPFHTGFTVYGQIDECLTLDRGFALHSCH